MVFRIINGCKTVQIFVENCVKSWDFSATLYVSDLGVFESDSQNIDTYSGGNQGIIIKPNDSETITSLGNGKSS